MKSTSFASLDKRILLSGVLGVLLLGGLVWTRLNAKSGGIPARAPLPRPNGFDLYASAATALQWPKPPLDAIVDTQRRSPQEAARLYTSARRAAFVASNGRVWNLMQQARAAQTVHPDTRNFSLAGSNVMATMPYNALRNLARGKIIEAKRWEDGNRWDLALQSGLDNLEMGRDIEHGATMIGSLVGMAMEAIGGAALENVPSHLSGIQAEQGARRLEKIIANGSSPADVLREEKWTMLTAASNFGSQSNRMAGLISRPLSAPIGPMMDGFIAQSDKPFALQTAPPVPTGIFSGLAAPLHPVTQGYGFHAARRENMESQLLLRLALRAYRVENGAYPDKLSQLAPKHLSKIPRDAFGRGEALRYRNLGDSYLLWSIGPDGNDNGGQSIKLKPGKKRVIVALSSLGDAIAKP